MIEFRLLYSGPLLAQSAGNTRVDLKHAIRKQFHPQLKRLCETNAHLQKYATAIYASAATAPYPPDPQTRTELALEHFGKRWAVCDYKFVPLVTKHLSMAASIDILFLRPEEPGLVIKSGDLDNRLKVVLDALRMPNNFEETGHQQPQGDEQRFFAAYWKMTN